MTAGSFWTRASIAASIRQQGLPVASLVIRHVAFFKIWLCFSVEHAIVTGPAI